MEFDKIATLFKEKGFLEASCTSLNKSISFESYKAQIWNENFGGMNFLKDHIPKKDPSSQEYPTALIALHPYYPPNNELKSHLRVSVYAQEKDYHKKINAKLKLITDELQKLHPKNNFTFSVDSAPVLERDLAYRAGLGWVGKNTCLISKDNGSLFYIAEILTDLTFSKKNTLQSDHCGTCTRCIDACPTGALTPRKLEVDKCISYRNIEDRDTSAKTLDKKLDSWFFGCDICQTVCPWNEKSHGKEEMISLSQPYTVTPEAISELKEILSKSNKQLDKDYKEFPLERARGAGLKRNALKIIHEHRLSELKDFLKSLNLSDKLQDLKEVVINSLCA
ncbi:MAG: tRNA epoxyqueuosine(34) reductase QueG [Bdellovibrionales bacterium]